MKKNYGEWWSRKTMERILESTYSEKSWREIMVRNTPVVLYPPPTPNFWSPVANSRIFCHHWIYYQSHHHHHHHQSHHYNHRRHHHQYDNHHLCIMLWVILVNAGLVFVLSYTTLQGNGAFVFVSSNIWYIWYWAMSARPDDPFCQRQLLSCSPPPVSPFLAIWWQHLWWWWWWWRLLFILHIF